MEKIQSITSYSWINIRNKQVLPYGTTVTQLMTHPTLTSIIIIIIIIVIIIIIIIVIIIVIIIIIIIIIIINNSLYKMSYFAGIRTHSMNIGSLTLSSFPAHDFVKRW